MTIQEFFNKYNNKYIDYDGYYGYQCMDLYRQFVKEVYGCQQSPPVSGAAKVWDTYNKDFFNRIPNGPVNYPLKGDIIIWNNRAGGGYGHIAIGMDATSYTFNSFDQNWPTGSRCHKQPHNYTNVLGWLTPKKKDNIVETTGQESTTSEPIPQPKAEIVTPPPETAPETLPTTTEGTTGSETPTEVLPNDGGDIRSNGVDSTTSEPVGPTNPLDVDSSPPSGDSSSDSTPSKRPQVDFKAIIASIVAFCLKAFTWAWRR